MTEAGPRQESDLSKGASKPGMRAREGAGYVRLEHIAHPTEAELLQVHGMGSRTLRQFLNAFVARGLSFVGRPSYQRFSSCQWIAWRLTVFAKTGCKGGPSMACSTRRPFGPSRGTTGWLW